VEEMSEALVDRKERGNVRRKVGRKKEGQVAGKKTYGRRKVEEEKENSEGVVEPGDGEPEDTHCGTRQSKTIKDVTTSKELVAARKKFAEVDEWEMEFESVDIGGMGSSWR